jgi:uncharacterized protein (TIGR03437 family)
MPFVMTRLLFPAFRKTGVSLVMLAACCGLRAQSVVALQANASPNVAETGLATVSVTGINFPAAAIVPANVTVTLSPQPPATGPVAQVQATTVASLAGTAERVSFVVPMLSITQPTPYLVTIADSVQGQLFTSGNSANLLVNPPATIQSVMPNAGPAGTSIAVTIQGLSSNFLNGSSSVGAGPGINVQLVAVNSPTVITAQFMITSSATPGPRTVTVTTATEVASLANAFTVIPGSLTIADFNPKSAPLGTLVTITGTNLQPSAGTAPQIALAKQGGGTIAGPISSATATSLAFVIPPGAASGPVNVTVNGNSASTTTPLTILPAFSLSAAPPAANVIQGLSTAYSVSLSASTGLDQPAALNVTGLPAGITATFNPSQITSGQTSILTVTAPMGQSIGTATLSVSAVASVTGIPVTQSTTVNLNIQPVPTSFATTSPLPPGEAGASYSQNIVVKGGASPYTFSVSAGLLPAGLSLDPTGILSGNPSSAGTSSFVVTVRDSTGASSTSQFSLTITPGPTITTASPLPNASTGVAYSQQIAVSGGATPYRFSISGALPSGLFLDVNGLLSGTPAQSAVGTFSFTVGATDKLNVESATKTFQITVVTSTPVLQASPSSLSFSAVTGGASPPSQAVSVVPVSSSQTSLAFRVIIDAGQSNTPAPSWITVTPSGGNAPAQLVVSVAQGTLAAGTYPARIQIIDANGNASDVGVTLTVTTSPAQLQVTPSSLAFSARTQTPGALVKTLVVDNSGGGSLAFTASVLGGSSWITSLSPNSGQATPNSPVYIQVIVNPQGLKAGSFNDVIQVSSAAGNVSVGVSLFVAQSGAILSVNVTGLRLQARQGGGYSNTETVEVLNVGDPTTPVNWTADLVSGANIVSLTPPNGTATATNPDSLNITATSAATQAAPGGYYALVRISDPNALNSPQYVLAVLDLQSNATVPLPDPSPAGLFFTATSHGPATSGQTVTVNTSSTTLVPFQVAASTTDGASWLVVSPASGSSSGQNPGTFMVSVNPSGLSPGVYTGSVNVSMSAALRTVNVTAVVLASGSTAHADVTTAQATGCTPSKLVLTETGLVSNFVVPATWPETLIVGLNDDCGAAVQNGSVVASFSNTDPPLTLNGDGQSGTYSATWQPGQVSSQTLVTLNATAGTLQPATGKLIGGISPNAAPSLTPGGTVNAFYRTSGALAPGTVAEVYGSGLASQTSSAGSVPLPLALNGTFALIGGLQSPLFYLSNGQLDVQIPSELAATQQYVVVVSANNTYTMPQTINLVPVQPGVAAFADSTLIAQHSDFTLVDSGHPAKPGEYLVMYLTAMGPTNPSVPSGTAAPSVEPLARVTVQPIVTVDGQSAIIAYAGLTPGSVGLYQVNFQVPPNANSGILNVVVSQLGITSNTSTLLVSQ